MESDHQRPGTLQFRRLTGDGLTRLEFGHHLAGYSSFSGHSAQCVGSVESGDRGSRALRQKRRCFGSQLQQPPVADMARRQRANPAPVLPVARRAAARAPAGSTWASFPVDGVVQPAGERSIRLHGWPPRAVQSLAARSQQVR
jgi:hypothetical protein